MADGRPWWMDNPDIAALSQRVLAEIEAAEPLGPDDPDPVLAEFYSGAIGRQLSALRDELADLRVRYRNAVMAAREAGFSWAEIGRLLGVSRQQVHRQFGARGKD